MSDIRCCGKDSHAGKGPEVSRQKLSEVKKGKGVDPTTIKMNAVDVLCSYRRFYYKDN